jgi:hypothetical protein
MVSSERLAEVLRLASNGPASRRSRSITSDLARNSATVRCVGSIESVHSWNGSDWAANFLRSIGGMLLS